MEDLFHVSFPIDGFPTIRFNIDVQAKVNIFNVHITRGTIFQLPYSSGILINEYGNISPNRIASMYFVCSEFKFYLYSYCRQSDASAPRFEMSYANNDNTTRMYFLKEMFPGDHECTIHQETYPPSPYYPHSRNTNTITIS